MSSLPRFSQINPATIVAELDTILAQNRAELLLLLSEIISLDWNFIQKLDDLDDRLQHFWSPINHLHAVKQTAKLRLAYNECLAKISAYSSELSQNSRLYQAIKTLDNGDYRFNYA